jgi:tRNA modification GTPase
VRARWRSSPRSRRDDFPETSDAQAGTVLERTNSATVAALAASHREGRVIGEGLVVARRRGERVEFLNALAGAERALVSPEPGTTRDWLDARMVWDGVRSPWWIPRELASH